MSITPQQTYAATHYGERAHDYVTSAVHAMGADLDEVEAIARHRPGARALDLGCGGGHVSYRLAPHVSEVVACDVTPAMIDAVTTTARERGLANVTARQAAAESLPFADASFDLVVCRFTAHHWEDVGAGLREARRVVRPDGLALFIDVVAAADPVLDTHLQAVEVLRDPSHVRNYTVSEWTAALGAARWQVEGLTMRRLRMVFDVWTARTRTPATHATAIRSLQDGAPPRVRSHFAIDAEGSFDIRSAAFVVAPA